MPIEWFKKYIDVAPSEAERARGYSHIATVHRKSKNYAAATEAAKQAMKEHELYAGEMFLLAMERGDRATAAKLEELLFAAPKFSNRGSRNTPRYPSYFRGYIAFKNGRTEEALENFRQLLRHAPATWDVDAMEDCLGNALLEIGRLDEAVAEYERILQLNPNYPLAAFYLAQAYERKGQTNEARASYERFLQTWKNADAEIPEIIAAKKFLGNRSESML